MRRILAAAVAAAALAVLGCGGGSTTPNQPPVAALTVDPAIVLVGTPVTFDATGSSDPDGVILSYRFTFADGSPEIATASLTTAHAYPRAGTYNVRLTVTDDDGEVVSIPTAGSPPITVVVLDTPQCSATLPCPDGLDCVEGICRCAGDLERCGDACVNTQEDEENCGGCGIVCSDGWRCNAGDCEAPPPVCVPPEIECAPGLCVDTRSDPEHCGGCDRPCDDGACIDGWCQPTCPPERPDMCPVGCVNLSNDPFNCGFCGLICESGSCVDWSCTMTLPPGTVLEIYPPPPYEVIRGLTFVNDRWFFSTGRRFVEYEPIMGVPLGDWFIANEPSRRAYGLAGVLGPAGVEILVTGAHNRFGSPLNNIDLEAYTPYGGVLSSADDIGGAAASDGTTLWIFNNETLSLITIDIGMMAVIDTRPVSGLAMGDWFHDLALDGYGGLWAVRADVTGPDGPLMKKIDIDSASVILDVGSPSMTGIGGVVYVDGSLWGLAGDGMYRMVP